MLPIPTTGSKPTIATTYPESPGEITDAVPPVRKQLASWTFSPHTGAADAVSCATIPKLLREWSQPWMKTSNDPDPVVIGAGLAKPLV
jgi:hypothetical protein